MDLSVEWQNLSGELNSKARSVEVKNITFDEKSHHLLQDLLFKLEWKLRWIRIIDIPLLTSAFFIKGDLRYLLLFIFITYEICRALGMRNLRKIKTGIDYNSSIKQVLTDNLMAINRLLRGEAIFGYIFLPLSGPIGLLAYKLYIHQSFEKVVNLPHFIVHAVLLALIGIPFIYISKKMNDSIFTKPLQSLTNKIADLMN